MPFLSLSTEDNEALEDVDVDDELEITLIARVTGVSRSDETGLKSVNLTVAVANLKQKPTSLKEAVSRAGEKHLMVRTQTEPAGG